MTPELSSANGAVAGIRHNRDDGLTAYIRSIESPDRTPYRQVHQQSLCTQITKEATAQINGPSDCI